MNTVRKIWENSNIRKFHSSLADSARFDEPMSLHTTFRLGGPADIFLEPATVEDLLFAVRLFMDNGCPVSVMGGGSNLCVADRGIRGAVIALTALRDCALRDDLAESDAHPTVRAWAGTPMEDLVEWCALRGFAGLERFAGLPGTVGGAVFMNARCYDLSVSDAFFEAEVLDFGDEGCTIRKRAFVPSEWGYKRSPFQVRIGPDPLALGKGSTVVLSASFSLSDGDPVSIREEMASCVRDREVKGHFRYPSAGSMFKNNHDFGKSSGKIIDEAGLRGFSVGAARVAPWHGNIVINEGGASAGDVRRLVEEVRSRVFAATGFTLESEVVFAGDW